MRKTLFCALLSGLLLLPAAADDFKREGNPDARAKKDPLEGKAPPALSLSGWMNTKGLDLKKLRGKVVVLKFWGVW